MDIYTYYYWRVDSIDPNPGGSPVTYQGSNWQFMTRLVVVGSGAFECDVVISGYQQTGADGMPFKMQVYDTTAVWSASGGIATIDLANAGSGSDGELLSALELGGAELGLGGAASRCSGWLRSDPSAACGVGAVLSLGGGCSLACEGDERAGDSPPPWAFCTPSEVASGSSGSRSEFRISARPTTSPSATNMTTGLLGTMF